MNVPMIELVFEELRDCDEGGGRVCLDNVSLERLGISKHQFAGYLSSLTKEGRYIPHDGMFGSIIVE